MRETDREAWALWGGLLPVSRWVWREEVGMKAGEGMMFAIEAIQLERATMHFEATDG